MDLIYLFDLFDLLKIYIYEFLLLLGIVLNASYAYFTSTWFLLFSIFYR